MDGERRSRRGEGGERLAFGHARGAARDARQHHALRHLRHGQLAPNRGGSGGKGRHARRQRIGNAAPLEPAQLLGERAIDREVARLEPRHVVARRMRRHELGLDLVERQRRGIDDARALLGNRRAALAARSSPHRGRPGSARSGRGRARVMRSAAPGPAPMKCTVMASPRRWRARRSPARPTMRGRMSRALRPAGGKRRGFGDRRHARQAPARAATRIAPRAACDFEIGLVDEARA